MQCKIQQSKASEGRVLPSGALFFALPHIAARFPTYFSFTEASNQTGSLPAGSESVLQLYSQSGVP